MTHFRKKAVPPTPLFCNLYANKGLTTDPWPMCVQIKDLAESRIRRGHLQVGRV
jgi:hypothetical protein